MIGLEFEKAPGRVLTKPTKVEYGYTFVGFGTPSYGTFPKIQQGACLVGLLFCSLKPSLGVHMEGVE